MLTHLSIRNIVLIESLHLDFHKGLNALTGETGAGKSILLDALGLALGARADSNLVRKGTQSAHVVATFDSPQNPDFNDLLEEQGIEPEDAIICKRQLQTDGRSKAFINDVPVSLSFLKIIAHALADIHGQFDTMALFDDKTHLALLDHYGGFKNDALKIADLFAVWKSAEKELVKSQKNLQELEAERDYIAHILDELEALDLQPGEEDALEEKRIQLKDKVKFLQAMQSVETALHQMRETGSPVWKILTRPEWHDQKAEPLFENIQGQIDELQSHLESLSSALGGQDDRYEDIEDRLYKIRELKRKHHCQYDELISKTKDYREKLTFLDNGSTNIIALQEAVKKAHEQYINHAKKLHEMRVKKAKEIEKLINKELPSLKLEKAQFFFDTDLLGDDEGRADGLTEAQIQVQTNENSRKGSLLQVVSGGELARFTLAIKSVLNMNDYTRTLIFDEVDSGIGGATAAAVGEKLKSLSRKHQLLVITHSPQVAAKADENYVIRKSQGKNTVTTVEHLQSAQDKTEEIARMLSGESVTDEARAAAGKLLEWQAA